VNVVDPPLTAHDKRLVNPVTPDRYSSWSVVFLSPAPAGGESFGYTRRENVKRDFDKRTGRPLVDGRDNIELLTTRELEADLTIAAAEPKRRAPRLDAVLLELARRRGRRVAQSA